MNDEAKSYLLFAAAGAIAGWLRFIETEIKSHRRKKFDWRVVVTSCMLGSLTSVVVISWWFDYLVKTQPLKCITLSLLLGYIQPNIVGFLSVILKGKIPESHDKDLSQDKTDSKE